MRRTLNPNTAAIGAAVLGAVLIALLFFREQVGYRLFPCCGDKTLKKSAI